MIYQTSYILIHFRSKLITAVKEKSEQFNASQQILEQSSLYTGLLQLEESCKEIVAKNSEFITKPTKKIKLR